MKRDQRDGTPPWTPPLSNYVCYIRICSTYAAAPPRPAPLCHDLPCPARCSPRDVGVGWGEGGPLSNGACQLVASK